MKKESKEFKYNRNKIPRNPGCYLFFDAKDELLYVGKAKDLRKRVSSYFQKTKKPLKTATMVKKIARIETRIVNSEMEALILENNLIKEFMPQFNVLLRDDKNFLYLRVTKEDFPRIEVTRRIIRDGSFYVGPKTSAKKFRETINFCQKVFQIRTCRVGIVSKNSDGSPLTKGAGGISEKSREKLEITSNPERKKIPCMDFHIKKCSGPCAGKISRRKYNEQVALMKKFLRGDTKEVIKNLTEQMMSLAKEKKFEAAAKIRDLIKSIEVSTEKQRVQFADEISRDFLNFYREKNNIYFVRLSFRQGRFIDQNEVKFKAGEFLEDAEVWEKVLLQFYDKVDENPAKIFVPTEPENKEQLEELLKTKIIVPQKGDKKKILAMAEKSAKNFAGKSRIEAMAQEEIFAQALPRLAEKLGLEKPPRRIECYDISHLSGTHTVASQVVFIDGKPKNSEYRRFKIKTLKSGEIDDFASMKEVLERRFRGISQKKESSNNQNASELPLLLGEGGGEVNSKESIKENWYKSREKILENAKKLRKKQTRLEEIMWMALRNRNFCNLKFRRQFPIENYILDFYCPAKKVAVEIDGIQHEEENNKDYDKKRTAFLKKKKIKVIRFSNADVLNNLEEVLNKLYEFTSPHPDPLPEGEGDAKEQDKIPRNPDLIVIDGGKGQLSAVLNVLKNMSNLPLNIEKQVIAIAKQEEEIFRGKFRLPSPDLTQDKKSFKSGLNSTDEIIFEKLAIDPDSAESKLLQRIRDEAHRFAISFNRNLREKSAKKSRLDEILGIGPKTKKELLQKFGSPAGIRKASDTELLKILNKKQLENLRKNL